MKNNLIIIFVFLSIHCNAQNLDYKITSGNSNIGKVSVKKVSENNTIQIEVVSSVKVKLFISIDFKYKLNSTYKNNILIFSSVTTYVNDKVHSTTITEKTGNYYTVTKNGHASKYINRINYSGSLLYFVEPKQITKIYSEFDGIAKPIKEISKGNYQIINPKNNHLSKYQYKNGMLESMTNYHKLMPFTLTKI